MGLNLAFYNNSEPAVLNDGFCTNVFKLLRGVRQSCPLSPYLFIVGAEIFACKIRQDKTIKGITVFQKEEGGSFPTTFLINTVA